MSIRELVFDQEDDFGIERTEQTANRIEITVISKQPNNRCPSCHCRTNKVHSYYARDVFDLPMLDKETRLRLRVRKFYCVNDECSGKIFSERFERHFQYRKRMTVRVQDKINKVALLMGGNGGNRLCRLMNLPVTSSTVIRCAHQSHVPEIGKLEAVGIDDWAYKKRLTYGTVVIVIGKPKSSGENQLRIKGISNPFFIKSPPNTPFSSPPRLNTIPHFRYRWVFFHKPEPCQL